MRFEYTIGHMFCGIGGSALGCAAASARLGDNEAVFRTVGGVDVDPLACQDFEKLTGVPAVCASLHEMQPAELRLAWGDKAPDVVMMSPPCKGFSGLLAADKAATPKYQEMNTLMLKAIHLLCETWAEPPAVIFIENVPRIASRGKKLISQVNQTMWSFGYRGKMGNHDCGELGGLAQRRKRWFALFRHTDRVKHMVYEPEKLPVRACGEVLGPLPLPGDVERGGEMHAVPQLSLLNWLRLCFIPAGGDWRDLAGVVPKGRKKRELFRRNPVAPWTETLQTVTGPGGSGSGSAVADVRFGNVDRVIDWDHPIGVVTKSPAPSSGAAAVADPRIGEALGITPDAGLRTDDLGVTAWSDPSGAVTGNGRVRTGRFAVSDPRFREALGLGLGAKMRSDALGVTDWSDASGTVTGEAYPTNGRFAVADPRIASEIKLTDRPTRHRNKYKVAGWDEAAPAIIGATRPGSGAASIADPRFAELLDVDADSGWYKGKYGVTGWDDESPTVIAGGSAADVVSVADPRLAGVIQMLTDESKRDRAAAGKKESWQQTAGVTPWTEPSPVVTAGASIHAGAFQVADPRVLELTCKPRRGAYRVMSWRQAAATVTASMKIDNGPAAVADPRVRIAVPRTWPVTSPFADLPEMWHEPAKKGAKWRCRHCKRKSRSRRQLAGAVCLAKKPPFVPVFVASDNTWHRPLTTWELMALQGFKLYDVAGKAIVLAGKSHTRWREAIGNAVPPPAAEAIGSEVLKALLYSTLGTYATTAKTPIWVRPYNEARAV